MADIERTDSALTRRGFLRRGSLAALGASSLGALTAAGCGSGDSGSKSKTKITFLGLFWLPAEIAAARQIVNAFNAQSKTIEVQYVQGSWATIDSKMTVAFSSGDVPEVFQYYDAGLVPWGENGLLTDLKSLMPASTWRDVLPGMLTSVTSPGKGVLGLPFEAETPLIYYNKALLAAAGVSPATAGNPWSWEQLHDNAAKLSNPGSNVYGVSVWWFAREILFKNGLAWQAGAQPVKRNGNGYAVDVNDPGTRAAIEYLASLFRDRIADPKAPGVADPDASFLSGRAALLIQGAWARTLLPTLKGAKQVKWGAMPFVKGPNDSLGSGAVQTLSIPASAKNKEAAAEFLKWWAKPQNEAKLCRTSGQLPPNVVAMQALKKAVGEDKLWSYAIDETSELKGQPYVPGWLPMLNKVWDPAMFALFKGTSTYEKFAATVNKDGTTEVQTAAGN